jgi:hypothetical protein
MTIQTITFHKRSGGKTGQVLGSVQIEKKLAKVEALYRKYYGAKMGRVKFYDLSLDGAREAKRDAGGYLQYTTEAVAGVWLDHFHKALGKAVKSNDRSEPVVVEIGAYKVDLSTLKRKVRGKAKVQFHPVSGKRILTPRVKKEVA